MFGPINWIRGFSTSINYLLRNSLCQNLSLAKLLDPLESVERMMQMKEGNLLFSFFCVCVFYSEIPHFMFSISGAREQIIRFFRVRSVISQHVWTVLHPDRTSWVLFTVFLHKVHIMHWPSVLLHLAAVSHYGRNHLILHSQSRGLNQSINIFFVLNVHQLYSDLFPLDVPVSTWDHLSAINCNLV